MACPARCADLIGQIGTVKSGEETPNAFDVLRIPSYFEWLRYHQRVEEIHALLATERCSCDGRRMALTYQAWSHINSESALINYVNTIRAATSTLKPAELVPLAVNRAAITEPSVRDPFPRRGQSFQDPLEYVQGDRRLRWRMMDWSRAHLHPYAVFVENTFWTALSLALRDSADYWAEVKSGANNYFTKVISDTSHPRNAAYRVLDAEIVRLSNLPGHGYQPTPLATQLTSTTFAAASRELWQVIADAFRVEVLVIVILPQIPGSRLAEPDTPHDVSGGISPVIPRGDHNSRQIFLAVDSSAGFPNWVYAAAEPDRRDNSAWRYAWHLPAQLASTSSLENSSKRRAEKERAGWRRCCFVEGNAFGNDGERLMKGAKEVLGLGGVGPLERVVDDKYSALSEVQETLSYLNCGHPL